MDRQRSALTSSQAQSAINEEEIVSDKALCGSPGPNFINQIRADFTNCALPSDSLAGNCITGEQNEPDNCGFEKNTRGLCSYCASSSPNATDSCCQASNVTSVCVGVALPTFTSLPPLFPSSTGTPSPSSTKPTSPSNKGLSGGAIAGIVIGSIVGTAVILALLFLLFLFVRRRRHGSQHGSIFNQPSPRRSGAPPGMVFVPHDTATGGLAPVPGGRVARMTALEGNSSDSHTNPPERRTPFTGVSDSDPYNDSASRGDTGTRPVTGKRGGSLSSNSIFGGLEASPHSDSNGHFSSPEGLASGQSEQLPFFKDYYSNDEIHPNDRVATLWAYQPRAGDEFELERGDMLRVVGIWDDGWATGVRVPERADDWEGKKDQRDSGVSGGSGRREASPAPEGQVKAFPVRTVIAPDPAFS